MNEDLKTTIENILRFIDCFVYCLVLRTSLSQCAKPKRNAATMSATTVNGTVKTVRTWGCVTFDFDLVDRISWAELTQNKRTKQHKERFGWLVHDIVRNKFFSIFSANTFAVWHIFYILHFEESNIKNSSTFKEVIMSIDGSDNNQVSRFNLYTHESRKWFR